MAILTRLFSALRGLCAVATFLMMILVVTDVALRYFRIGSIPSGVEIVALSVVLIVFLPSAALQQKRQHLRVMVLVERLSPRLRAVADLISWSIFLMLFLVLLWQGWEMALYSLSSKEVMIMSLLPVYPVRFCLVIGCFFMVIQLAIDLKSTWGQVVRGEERQQGADSGN